MDKQHVEPSAGFVAAWFGYTTYFVIGAIFATSFAAWYVLMFDHVERLVLAREALETSDD